MVEFLWSDYQRGRLGNVGFGPISVELHRLSASLDLGNVSWVAERGAGVRVEHLAPALVRHSATVGRRSRP